MSKKKEVNNYEAETKQDKFRRIVNVRIKMLLTAYNRITRMTKQSSYDISQEDAIKVLSAVEKFHNAFVEKYQPLANGEKLKKSDDILIKDVF